MEKLENKFVSGTWAPPFLSISTEPPKKKKKQKITKISENHLS